MAKLIIGCGYLGLRVARAWRAAGETVYAVTRGGKRGGQLAAEGLIPVVADVTRPESLSALPAAATVLYAVGFDRSAGSDMRQVYVDGLRAALDALPDGIARFIYIGSTGVYGQDDGSWVDEDSPCLPTRESGRVCLDAERTLREHRLGARAIVLRLAGLYGPGRVPRRVALLAGESVPAAEGRLNLIHVADAARVVLAAERHATPPRLYTVSDGHPPLRGEYYAEAARLLGAPSPRLVPADEGAAASERGGTDKLVSNRRMLEELHVELEFPTYREGLRDALAAAGE